MRRDLIGLLIQETSRLFTAYLQTRPRRYSAPEPAPPEFPVIVAEISEGTAGETDGSESSVAAGCVPCSINHLATCSGLLSEGMRFARSDGLQSNEVIDRVTHCLEELSTMEREDLAPVKVARLPEWERALANEAANTSRNIRHRLEGLASINDLEAAAADAQGARQDIGRGWFKERLSRMDQGEKEELTQKAIERINNQEE